MNFLFFKKYFSLHKIAKVFRHLYSAHTEKKQPSNVVRMGSDLSSKKRVLWFVKTMIRSPRAIGAVAPSSAELSSAMAQLAFKGVSDEAPYIIEVGAGTGVITRCLCEGYAPESIAIFEQDVAFASFLECYKTLGVTIYYNSATKLQQVLRSDWVGRVGAIVSGLPMRNFPPRFQYQLLKSFQYVLHAKGSLVQFTYGPSSSIHRKVLKKCRMTAEYKGRVWRNIPPAALWVYQNKSKIKPDTAYFYSKENDNEHHYESQRRSR